LFWRHGQDTGAAVTAASSRQFLEIHSRQARCRRYAKRRGDFFIRWLEFKADLPQVIERLQYSLQMLLTIQVFAFQPLDFQAVRTVVPNRLHCLDDFGKVNAPFTQSAELPLTFAAPRVLKMDMNDPVGNLLDVFRGINVVV
jgi:hypothetical protein